MTRKHLALYLGRSLESYTFERKEMTNQNLQICGSSSAVNEMECALLCGSVDAHNKRSLILLLEVAK